MILLACVFRGKHYQLCQNVILKQCGVTGGMALDVKATQNNPLHGTVRNKAAGGYVSEGRIVSVLKR
jgi:hypothetical protein